MKVTILDVQWNMLANGANYAIDARNESGDIVTFWTTNGWKASACRDNIEKAPIDVRATPAGELIWVSE